MTLVNSNLTLVAVTRIYLEVRYVKCGFRSGLNVLSFLFVRNSCNRLDFEQRIDYDAIIYAN